MIPVQFRPKYDIEQYVITFQFPEGTIGDVSLAVEVEVGEPGLLLGPVFSFQHTVSVGIAGGVPGSVYRILCSFGDVEFVGRVAVKESAAVMPEGASVAPFTQSVTTPPYPIIFFDSLNVTAETSRGVQWEQPLDELNIGALTVGGSLREVLQTYTIDPDPVDIFAITFAGELEDAHDPLKQYDYGSESLDIGATTTGGSIKLTLLRYENYLPESFDIGGITTGGSLT